VSLECGDKSPLFPWNLFRADGRAVRPQREIGGRGRCRSKFNLGTEMKSTKTKSRITAALRGAKWTLRNRGPRLLSVLIASLLLWQSAGVPAAIALSHRPGDDDTKRDTKPAGRPPNPAKPRKFLVQQGTEVLAALVNNAPAINGSVQGSVQQLSGENVTLNGSASISSALFLPGTPKVVINGRSATIGSQVAGSGSTSPSNYTLTLNGNASLNTLVTQTNPVSLPSVPSPTAPTGTSNVTVNNTSEIPTNFSNINNLTLNGNVGNVNVPPGAYGKFTANGNTSFTFGVQGSSAPSTYSLSELTLNSNSSLQIIGPVILNLGSTLTMNGSAGTSTNPLNLTINIASGGVTLNGGVSLYAAVQAPAGQVTINGNSLLQGSVACNNLTINGNGVLSGVPGVLQSISPTAGSQGQSLSVTLSGDNTHWVNGQTVASFGNEISVGGASSGTLGPIQVNSPTSATASIVISPTAALAPRTVTITTPVAGFSNGELETLISAFTVTSVTPPGAASSTVSTIAGLGGTAGFADGSGSSAEFDRLSGLAVGPDGSVYVADTGNNRIRKVQNQSGAWTVSTLAGTGTAGFGDGPATSAEFSGPTGVAVDSNSNVYVADTGNNRIREISGGTVSTLGGNGTAGLVNGAASSAEFNAPKGVAVDNQGNLYIADTGNSTVRFISTSGQVSSVAGDGTIGSNDSPNAHFNGLIGVGFDGTTAYIYVADTLNERIRRLDPSGNVIILTGSTQGYADGSATTAQFAEPGGLAVDGAGKIIVADTTNSLIREVDPTQIASGSSTAVYTLAGTGIRALTNGAGNVTTFFTPGGVGVGPSSAIYVADTGNQVIRQILVPPIIDSFSPVQGSVGSTVTINGERFDGTSPQNNTVRFTQTGGGTVQAQVTSATRNQLAVTVPAGAATGPIAVTTQGGTGTSAANFVVVTAPIITSFTPQSGEVGSTVTLTGQNFTGTTGGTTVTFAGNTSTIPALITSLTSTQISVLVPNGAMTGFITVTTDVGSGQTATVFTVSPGQQDYQLTVTPSSSSVILGSSTNYVVYLTSPLTTFSQLSTLAISGLPASITPTFSPQQITAGATSTLNVNLSGATLSPGSYNFTISGSALVNGAPLVRTATATLNVLNTGQTAVSGRVLSTNDTPLLGVTVSLDGQSATTDSAGGFILFGINAGTNRPLMVDGRTASAANQTYPVITEPANVVAGQANQAPYNFYLPPIDTQYDTVVNPNAPTVVTNPTVPGLQMTIPAGAKLTNLDGTPVSTVSITPVAIDRTPAPLPSNVSMQLVYTSQPGGATSSLPIPIVYPNFAGLSPGTVVNLYNFNHNTVQWEVYGTGQVSADGRTIAPQTNPQTGQPYGLTTFSWHGCNASKTGNPGPPCCLSCQPVDLSTGEKLEFETDISFGGARGGLTLERVFNSDLAATITFGRFGRGWKDNFSIQLTASAFTQGGAGNVIFPQDETGRLFSYAGTNSDGSMSFTNSTVDYLLGDVVKALPNGTFQYRYKDGAVLQFNSSGLLTAQVDRNGNTTTLTYSGGNLTQITDPVGRSITLTYTIDRGNPVVTSATDPIGRTWQYAYTDANVDSGGQLVSVTDPLGFTETYGYSLFELTTITDKRGNVAKIITYDANDRVVQEQFADGGIETFTYSLSGTIVTSAIVVDPLNRISTRRFNGNGYPIGMTDALGQTTVFQRDIGTNVLLSTIGPCGCAQGTFTYDGNGNTLTSTDALGNTASFQYDPVFNNVTQYTDKLGRISTYGYDPNGNLTSMTQGSGSLNLTTTQAFDSFGEITNVTDPLGNTTTLQYDSSGDIASTTNPLGNTWTLQYDGVGRPTSTADPMGRAVAYSYNALHMTSSTDTAGATTQSSYDPSGNQTNVTDALGHQWLSVYDANNRVISSTDPLGRTTTTTYDLDGEPVSNVSPSGRTIQYGYDSRGQMLSRTDALQGVTIFTYDSQKNLTSITNQRGFATSFTYDQLYRLISQVDPAGASSSVGYDAVGNITSATDKLGRQSTLIYDQADRPTQATFPDSTIQVTYDEDSRATQVADTAGGTIQWTFDNANRITSERTQAGVVSYTYNAANQLASMTPTTAAAVNTGYDSFGRVQTISQGTDSFTYSYDALSRRTGLQRPNGVSTSYVYDALSRLVGVTHTGPGGHAIESLTYGYDLDGEVSSVGSLAFGAVLPPATSLGQANPANRVGSVGAANFTFDAQGETASKTDNTGTTNYQWDARGRLTQVTLPNSQVVSYGYDTLGRRTTAMAAGLTTNFLYDRRSVVSDADSDGTVTNYINAGGTDEKLEQSSGNGALYFTQDRLGSTTSLTDAAGNVAESEAYGPFGSTTGSASTRYGYIGRELDAQTGLMLFRARWYDPQQGRFLTEDPIEFGGGMNFYAYTGDNPETRKDPSGLGWRIEHGPDQYGWPLVYYSWDPCYKWKEGDTQGVKNDYAFVDVDGDAISLYGEDCTENHSWGVIPQTGQADSNIPGNPPPTYQNPEQVIGALLGGGYRPFWDPDPRHWGGSNFAKQGSPTLHITVYPSCCGSGGDGITIHSDAHSPVSDPVGHILNDWLPNLLSHKPTLPVPPPYIPPVVPPLRPPIFF
jgi:RHS repeat-associated protein